MPVFRDLRHALRMLGKAPVFTLVSVALLAIGMAATPAVFSFADALFWKPLDAPHSERLVRVFINDGKQVGGTFSYPEFRDLRDHTRVFEEMAAEYPTAPLHVVDENDSREHNGAVVTANYFSMVGVNPLRGRFFRADEDAVPDRDPVVVISARLWHSRYAGEPSILGREISINGVAFRVIGIAPQNFLGDEPGIASTELWIPTAMLHVGYRWCDAYAGLDCAPLHIFGRLAAGQTVAAAQAELNTIAAAAHLPAVADRQQLVVSRAVGVRPDQQAELAPQLRLLMAIALLLLLIACANVAGLLLARGVARRREVAVRLALGARPIRIVGQFLTENLLLAMLGAALGLVLGLWLRDSFVSLFSLQGEGGYAFYDVRVDWRVMVFSGAAALVTGLLFGLLPAIRAIRCDVVEDLKSGAAGGIGLQRGSRLRDLLAAGQVCLSLVLLVAAGLMVRSAQGILSGANFDPQHVVLLRLRPRLVKYTPAQSEAFYAAVADRLPQISGVEDVAFGVGGSGLLWMPRTGPVMKLSTPGQADTPVRVLPVNDTFFATLRIPLLQGRVFGTRDRAGTSRTLVVNQSAAKRYWPASSALGQVLVLDGQPYSVVGVVADLGLHSLRETASPQLYSAFWQNTPGSAGDVRMAIRVEGDPGAALPRLHQVISSIDPRVPLAEEMTLTDQVKSYYAAVWLARSATVWCGVLALVLSAVGLYSVLAFAVRSRTREIGMRVALGARPIDVIKLVVGRGLRICAFGTAGGLVLAVSTWRLLANLIYGVRGFDVLAFIVGPAALLLVTLAATWLPARRAAQVDPMSALRYD